MLDGTRPRGGRRRPFDTDTGRHMAAHAPSRSQSTEEYLEAIYKLGGVEAEVTVRDLAATLGVARPSVSEMLSRLAAAALVRRGTGGAATLTPDGSLEAARLVRRHRLSERFLADYLELPWDQVHDEACKLEHVLSDAVEARLAEQLGNPETCPHGHQIPGEDGTLDEVPTRALSDLEPGEEATIVRIADERSDLLRYLASLGLLPDTALAVEGVAPFGGPLLVRVGGAQYALGREVADTIYVSC
jgi:DtxR family transcriptional regulator, Mn-dependent transcriptional regulator